MSDHRKTGNTGTTDPQTGTTITRVASNTGDTGSVNTRDTESVMDRQAAWIVVYELRVSHGLPNGEDAFGSRFPRATCPPITLRQAIGRHPANLTASCSRVTSAS